MSEPSVIRQRVMVTASEVHDGDIVDINGSMGGGRGRVYARNAQVVERDGRKYIRIGDTLEPIAWHSNSLMKRV